MVISMFTMNTDKKSIKVHAIDFRLSRKLTAFARNHVEKLKTFNDRIESSHVLLRLEPSSQGDKKVCAITLMIPGRDLFACKVGHSFEESIATAVEALRRQIEHWKT
jgi:putative sigma-54 modulation protein